MDQGSAWRDPRKFPVPVPSTGIFDTPTVRVCVNSSWVSHIDGLLGRLLERDAWIGTDAEIDNAIQQVMELMTTLDDMGNCDVCDDLEFRIQGDVLQWNCNDTGWVDLGVVVGDDGAPGAPGDDGREIELQKSATHIQWRYVGDPTWTNLVALSDLKGDPGDPASVPALPKRWTGWHGESVVTVGNPLSFSQNTNQFGNGAWAQSPAANGNTFTQSFWIRAGTYTFAVLGITNVNKGKIDWYIDNTLVVSGQDWYSASSVANVIKTASVTIATDGYHTLKGVVNGRNASASDWQILISEMWLRPSAD